MDEQNPEKDTNAIIPSTRRDFLKKAGGVAAGSALTGVSVPHVFGAEDNTIRV
ncbi:MAG: twin-arginine translocation signal domain-containing protein, partial [Verrucomicrobiota bacterium]